jgi:hypothetical protein
VIFSERSDVFPSGFVALTVYLPGGKAGTESARENSFWSLIMTTSSFSDIAYSPRLKVAEKWLATAGGLSSSKERADLISELNRPGSATEDTGPMTIGFLHGLFEEFSHVI